MYNVGQLRRNQIDSYSKALSYRQDYIRNEAGVIDFWEPCLYLSGENVASALYGYYLKFEVKQRPDSVQDFTLKLQSDEVDVDNIQSIRNFSVKQGVGTTTFELIFNPNSTYNQIIFELRRMSLDFYTTEQGKSGRVMEIKVLQFDRLINVITSYLVGHYPGLATLRQIGIQGPPGLLFFLNGEEMRIGRSGVYELYHEDVAISYISFIIKDSLFTQDGKDFFIMDFKY